MKRGAVSQVTSTFNAFTHPMQLMKELHKPKPKAIIIHSQQNKF